jgi:pyrimidine operon attenuation protein/uracil phosphoribosyltransferase
MSISLPDPESLVQALAAQMRGKLAPDAALVGIYSGGPWLAQRLHAALGVTVPLGTLAVTLHRDDFGFIGLHREARRSQIPFPVDGREIILVDDVLYTGRTIRAALDALFDCGRPRKVQLLVLIDRGHRELPIEAAFVGRRVQTTKQEVIEVKLEETDNIEKVMLVERVSADQS